MSAFNRDAAEEELKATAVDASHHSSGTVLNMADENSKYAHGKLHRTGSIDENTQMPTAETTTQGAYTLGSTNTADVATNYDNKFTEPATHTVGTGSRTIQELPEQVHDLGSTIQTKKTTHVLQTEAEPVQYIPPQGHAINTVAGNTATYSSTIPQTSTVTGSYATSAQNTNTGATAGHTGTFGTSDVVGQHTTGLPAGQSGVVQHHGIVGQNQTITPQNVNVNASSGSAVGTSLLGMPHGTPGSTGAGTTSAHNHTTSHDASATTTSPKQKESLLSKIKHAIHK